MFSEYFLNCVFSVYLEFGNIVHVQFTDIQVCTFILVISAWLSNGDREGGAAVLWRLLPNGDEGGAAPGDTTSRLNPRRGFATQGKSSPRPQTKPHGEDLPDDLFHMSGYIAK